MESAKITGTSLGHMKLSTTSPIPPRIPITPSILWQRALSANPSNFLALVPAIKNEDTPKSTITVPNIHGRYSNLCKHRQKIEHKIPAKKATPMIIPGTGF